MTQNDLYRLLLNLRDSLKKQFANGGKTPTICTDNAIQEMTAHPPRFKSDLINIEGLGQTFVEKYGDYFMPIFQEYYKSRHKTINMKSSVQTTLKSLENRLVNICRKNKLLYMGKIYNKTAFDTYSSDSEYNSKVIDLIMGKSINLTLCEMSLKDNWEKSDKRFKKALQLIREINKEERESGQCDLFLGYPYVMGKAFGENFSVRAPLALFPIAYEKRPDRIIIKLDKSKDIMFNSNLILMQNKFLGKADEIPEFVWEDFDKSTFLETLKGFYKQHDINISGELGTLEKFEDLSLKDFPDYHNGEFHLSNNAILGKFSLYSTALQKDFRKLINASEINTLVDNLLEENSSQEENVLEYRKVDEQAINYINELNSSQEQAVLTASNTDQLVIQGPPGTGKSQTITSLIADAVNKGQSVLMVSQKKAALDVIHSRLGKLSNFAIMVNDTKDKSSFYKQLQNLFFCNKDSNFEIKNFNDIANDIDININKCENIANSIYSSKINKTEIYKIYSDNESNFWLTCTDEVLFNNYFKNINIELTKINYYELRDIRDKFSNNTTLENLVNYTQAITKYPFLQDIKSGLRQLERKSMERAFNDFAKSQEDYLRLSFLPRLFKSGKRKKEFSNLFNQYFIKSRYRNQLYKATEHLLTGITFYSAYDTNKSIFNNLSTNEKMYLNTIYQLSVNSNESITDINSRIFDFIIFCSLTDFEEQNRSSIDCIHNFPSIINNITTDMLDKIDLTKARMKYTLSKAFYNEILLSKRYLEICRQIESRRKWSISKFMQKFSFELLSGIKIWLMTPETVSEVLPFEYGLFDILIFDEASQIYIEKGLPSITRANRVIIAGDHKQLRPSSLGFGRIDIEDEEILDEDIDTNAVLEEESLLDLARFKYPSVLLNYHYRSKYEELINFSNYAFYGGRLNVSPNTFEPETPPIEVVKISDGLWVNRCNKKEAIKVVEIIKKHLKTQTQNQTIGVITFNTNQRDAILDELDRECLKDEEFATLVRKELDRKDNGEDIGLFVKNIENVQGDERDHIIFSIGYAPNEDGKVVRNFGWLNQQGGENRLNVAISRAKQKITVVTSIYPEELTVDDLKNDGPKLFRKYLEYCSAISKKDKTGASVILNSLSEIEDFHEDKYTEDILINQVTNALVSQGLEVEKHIGYGNYKVDLAIKSSDHKKYILGIEFDTQLYKSSNTRERDIFRDKYLKCRNWTTYRLWSINWWHNPTQELENIIKLYNSLNK